MTDAAPDSPPRPPRPKKGEEFTLEIATLDRKGRGRGSHGGCPVIVPHALPGSAVEVQVLRRRRDRVEGRVVRVATPSPHEVAAVCPHHRTCGGCTFQTLAYGVQLQGLQRGVADVFRRYALPTEVPPVIGCEPPLHYRNKMEFTFGARRWVEAWEPADSDRSFAVGLHALGRFDRIVDVTSCAIGFEGADGVLNTVRDLARAQGLAPWDVHRHQGFLRHLVLRRGVSTGETMVYLVTAPGPEDEVRALLAGLREAHPSITTAIWGVSGRAASVALAEESQVMWGPGVIRERILDLDFVISPQSFFQTNSRQAEVLFSEIARLAEVQPADVVWDLYCGAGAITLVLGRQGGALVTGFEVVASAVADARRNASGNGMDHIQFVEGDVFQSLPTAVAGDTRRPDVVVVDPPRAGLHPKVLEAVAALAPRRLIYVSCNVETAAPQVAWLLTQGFRLTETAWIDMFPHTPHVEGVFRLDRP